MKEKSIIFSTPMVRAILAGQKTMTRRVQKSLKCPYQIGQTLWVRETFAPSWLEDTGEGPIYKADFRDDKTTIKEMKEAVRWKPSIFMPRKFSRIDLEVTSIKLERIQDITEVDAIKEGFKRREHFIHLWDKLNKNRGYGFETDCMVWVISFKRIKP